MYVDDKTSNLTYDTNSENTNVIDGIDNIDSFDDFNASVFDRMDEVPQLTVSALTAIIKTTMEEAFYNLTVEGEVSGFKISSVGHWYFSLKDSKAVINAVIWKGLASRLNFIPKDGQKVVVNANINVYEPRGTYQLICSSIKPYGEGDILAMLEERKRHYAKLGYFDEDIKKPIPKNPNKVAVITSPTGAALQDILQITGRRCPFMDIIILPAVVQGSDAALSIAARIKEVNDFLLAPVMIVGRGGGSIEDLLPFSEDCVIEAIFHSEIPVISAVGHEIDWALSDYVADLRAPTPSAAAELVCQDSSIQKETLDKLKKSMTDNIWSRLDNARQRLVSFSQETIKKQLESKLSHTKMRLDFATESLRMGMLNLFNNKKNRYNIALHKMQALSPLSVLDRGYGILSKENGNTIKSIRQIKTGETINIRLFDGQISASVENIKNIIASASASSVAHSSANSSSSAISNANSSSSANSNAISSVNSHRKSATVHKEHKVKAKETTEAKGE